MEMLSSPEAAVRWQVDRYSPNKKERGVAPELPEVTSSSAIWGRNKETNKERWMATSFNKITIVGYLGRDAEIRYTPQGTAVSNFSIATSERRKDRGGEQQDITTWFRVSLWGKQAESLTQYLNKGKLVYVEGRLRTEEFTDRDGNKRQSIEVTASDVQLLGSRNEMGGGGSSLPPGPGSSESGSDFGGSFSKGGKSEDDIPF